ncbi:Endonuclease/exonuclease/phosphatase [Stachybotrys elegans]|uniref:Endonuclease/exonuclease/phosphatase n=1 Tax=Stachybotrys elegans TaxID=80388 RepID=A0A8K0WW48_9HYPO|nr:Endonuclease/exonuclease/phosphatase [Stachybotrys elegans]
MKLINLVALASTAAGVAQALDVRLMTYNIRQAVVIPTAGERWWFLRRPLFRRQIQREVAGRDNSMLCFQEALNSQVQDIQSDLGREWTYIGVGRDDGVRGGEFSPIFYRPSSWRLLDSRTYWLSQNPDQVGSVGWDAALPRILTVGRFQHTQTGEPLVFMCTHFDHQGQVARENSARLIDSIAESWAQGSKVFVGGDFNVAPGNPAYSILASELRDLRSVVPQGLQSGPAMTYTAFTASESDDAQLDHLFVKDPAGVEWRGLATLSNTDNGVYISDHRAVVVDFTL